MNYKKIDLVETEGVPENVAKVWEQLMHPLKREFPNDIDLDEEQISIYEDVWSEVMCRLAGNHYADLWDEGTRKEVVSWMQKTQQHQHAFSKFFSDPDWFSFYL